MLRKNRVRPILFVILIAVLVIVGLTWVNTQFSKNNPGGNDFLAHYIGARSLIFEGKSPYSDEVALEIQQRVFGRPAEPGEIEHRVVYPLYSILFFAPFALIKDYAIARVAWMTVMEITLLVTGYLALQMTNWKPKIFILALLSQFSVLWYHGFRAVINGNAVIVVAFFIAAALYALQKHNHRFAGLFLAFSTIKPNLVLLFLVFVLIWCLYRKNYQVIVWFLGSMLVLTLGGMAIIPDWIIQNMQEILRYPGYNPPGSVGEVIALWLPEFEGVIRWGIGIGLGTLLGVEVWAAKKGNYERFLWAACLTLTISQWIGIATDPGNFVILFIPLILVLASLEERWKRQAAVFIPVILGVLFFGLWGLFIVTLSFEYQPMQSSLMFFPLPGFLLIGLYWIKWWVAGGASPVRMEEL